MKSREYIDFVKQYISRGRSIMLRGVHGVGKTAMINTAIRELGFTGLYFSGSTMDPYIELIGVPRQVKEGKHTYLEMVRRKEFADDLVDVVFIDEYNRSKLEVRNALLELIQSKSIHGHVLTRLKSVIVAVNPDNHPVFEYDVEKMDHTQTDKFCFQIDIPYEVAEDYMLENFGVSGSRAAAWWNSLPDSIRYRVSPRRLCWILEELPEGARIEHMLPEGVDREGLLSVLSVEDDAQIKLYADENNQEAGKRLINDPDKQRVVLTVIESDADLCEFYLPLIKSNDVLAQIARNNSHIYAYMLDNLNTRYRKILCDVLSSSKDTKFIKPALKSDLFDIPKVRELENEELNSLELINYATLPKSTEILYQWVMSCKQHGNLKQNKKAIAKVIESLSSFDDVKLSSTAYPFVYAELKDEKVKGLFEIGNALFQLKVKQYKAAKAAGEKHG